MGRRPLARSRDPSQHEDVAAFTLGLVGDTMMGRRVGEAIRTSGPDSVLSTEVVDVAHEVDALVLNLECCISDRGRRWPDPAKPFFFRAPPAAVDLLVALGVDCVTLANNHALDYGADALIDTLDRLADAGISTVGAGATVDAARSPARLTAKGISLTVLGLTDHPRDFAAGPSLPGVAYADLRHGTPDWVIRTIASASVEADLVLATPHWGPNMVDEPVPHVRRSGPDLVRAGATLVAGHSAHVFHGLLPPILWDLGDFVHDYAVDSRLRNDLGLFWLIDFDGALPIRAEAVPLALDYCHTRLAHDDEARWIIRRLIEACSAFDVPVAVEGGRLVVEMRTASVA